MSQQSVRIFVSSPSDVQPERERVDKAVERLQHEYGDRVDLEIFRWEETYYTAREGFQQQIEKKQSPGDADLVLCILWKRLGSTLPGEFNRPDGTPRTGTEYEFEVAMERALKEDIPDIFLYRKNAEILFHSERVDQEKAELQALNAFWGQWVRNEEGHFTAGFKSFEDPEEFETLMESDLRAWLKGRFQTAEWPESKGSPYRGLEVFYAEHADIFFGRRRAIREIRARLLALSEKEQCEFLLILGPSGSGKSSIIRAGLLPAVQLKLPVPGIAEWRYCPVRPSELGDDLLHGLALAMSSEGVLPEILQGDSTSTNMLSELWRTAPQLAQQPVTSGLGRVAKALQAEDGLKNTPEVRLLLLIDQLEELFHCPQTERDLFLDVIESLAHSKKVWIVATLRSDLYGEMQAIPKLMNLKSRGRQYDLLAPGDHELREIITGPAAMAGLQFEQTDEGSALDERLLDEAKEAPGALPLLEYTLSQLYDARNRENRTLTIQAYERMGGLKGAIGQKAEAILSKLPEPVQKSLTQVLLSLVTISSEGKVSARVQPYADYEESSHGRELVDAFLATSARLLTIQQDTNHQPVIRVSHEALLTHWPRAKTIIEENKQDIELRAILEQEAGRWEQAEQQHKTGYLRQAGKALEEARDLLRRKSEDLSAELRSYIQKSIDEVERKARQRTRIIKGLGAGAGVLVLVMAVLTWFAFLGQIKSKNSQAELLLNSSIYLAERGDARQAAESLIDSIELNPDNRIAVARLTSLLTQRSYPLLRSEIKLFDSKVLKIIKSPDEKNLAILSQQGNASIIDIATAKKWPDFLTSVVVDDVAFSSDGKLLAIKTQAGDIQIWDMERKQKLHNLEDGPGTGVLTISATGRYVLGRRFWEISGAQAVNHTSKNEKQSLVSAHFLEDDKLLLTIAKSGAIKISPIAEDPDSDVVIEFHHNSSIRNAAVSNNGKWLATSGDDQMVKIWRLDNGNLLQEIDVDDQVTDLVIDLSRLITATLSGTVKSWDIASGSLIEEKSIHKGSITDLVVDNNQLLTASWDGTATMSGIDGPILEPMRHAATVYSIASSANSGEVFTGSVDGILRHWKYVPSKFRFDRLHAKQAIDLLAHDDLFDVIAVASGKGRILEIHNRPENHSLVYHSEHSILHVGVSPDGQAVRWITSAGEIFNTPSNAKTLDGLQPELLSEKPLRVLETNDWNRVALQFGQRQLRLWNTDRNYPMSLRIQTQSPIRFLLAMPQTNLIGIVTSNKMGFWDLKTGLPYAGAIELPGGVNLIGHNFNRVYIVAGKNIRVFELDNQHRIGGRAPQLEPIGEMSHQEDVVTLEISTDGLSLVSSSLDGSLQVWDTASFKRRLSVNLGNPAHTVDISPDGNWLIAGSQDGSVRIIDLNEGTPVADAYEHVDSVSLVQFDKRGNQIVSASANDGIRLSETGLHLQLPAPEWLPDFARQVAGINKASITPDADIAVEGNWTDWRKALTNHTPGEIQ
jgi:WD40 repeat protein